MIYGPKNIKKLTKWRCFKQKINFTQNVYRFSPTKNTQKNTLSASIFKTGNTILKNIVFDK